jgi:hypothetical protein
MSKASNLKRTLGRLGAAVSTRLGLTNGACSKLRFAPQKRCSVVYIQLVIRPFLADFDLSGGPPDYKTAALPIELRRHPQGRLAEAVLEGGCGQI